MINNMSKVKPLNSKVILVEWNPEKEESTILIPDKREPEKIFEVLDDGGNEGIKIGDKVLIDDYAGKERTVWGEKYYFVDYSDLIARLQ